MRWFRQRTPIARAGATHDPETYVAASLLSTLTTLGLTGNLKLCLDAGEGDSYTSGQSWLDLSGNGYDFFLGADAAATATDPTFNGVADALSSAEYWSFDAGDYFKYDQVSNEAWMDNIHKDNALFTLAGWVYPAGAANNFIMGTDPNNVAQIGFSLFVTTSTGTATFNVLNGGGAAVARQIANASAGWVDGAWQFFGLSVNEAGNTGFFQRNAVAQTPVAAAYTSPSASAATNVLDIGATGGGNGKLPNGARIAMVMAFDTALTQWQLEQIYNKTRRRFGV